MYHQTNEHLHADIKKICRLIIRHPYSVLISILNLRIIYVGKILMHKLFLGHYGKSSFECVFCTPQETKHNFGKSHYTYNVTSIILLNVKNPKACQFQSNYAITL